MTSNTAEYMAIFFIYAILIVIFMSALHDRVAWFWFTLASWIFLISTLCYLFGGYK